MHTRVFQGVFVAFLLPMSLLSAAAPPARLDRLPTGVSAQLVASDTPVSPVRALAVRSDGTRIATGLSGEAPVRVWNASGRLVHSLSTHREDTFALVFSPDGRVLISYDGGRKVRLWDQSTGKLLRHWFVPSLYPVKVAFSPDARSLAVGYPDGRVELRDGGNGKQIATLTGDTGKVTAVAFAPDGKRLATASFEPVVRIWEVETNKLVRTIHEFRGKTHSLALSPDGAWLATAGEADPPTLRDLYTRRPPLPLGDKAGTTRCFAFSPDGRYLAVGGAPGLQLWELASGRIARRVTDHPGTVTAVTFSPDGRRLITGNSKGLTLVWNLSGQGKKRPLLSPVQLRTCWDDLASVDAEKAGSALAALVERSGQSLEWLAAQLRPAECGPLGLLVADLDNDDFATREAASRALARMGRMAEPALRRCLEAPSSPEVRSRADRLFRAISGEWSGSALREIRSVHLLELIGTEEARRQLALLAKGDELALLTREARLASARLREKPAADFVASLAPLPPTGKLHPAEKAGARSGRDLGETSIVFTNCSGRTVKVYWLDYDGDRVHYYTLEPDASYTQPTYLKHPWVITDSKDNALEIHYPQPRASTVKIGGAEK